MDNKAKAKKIFTPETIGVVIILAIIVVLFIYFFKDIMQPLFGMQLNNDIDGASELLRNKGVMGGISVILIEALQMIVIVISAEFIQIASGLSYPIYLSIPLCDIGICLGATIIFLMVRVFKFKSSTYEKNRGMIDKITSKSKERNIVLLLYLLFFMPFIPFGAICYYGSSTNISYGKYMLTVATSAVPSILVSVAIGRAGMLFFTSQIPLWLLVVIVIVLSIALFLLIYWFMQKFVLKETDKTPDSLFFDIFMTGTKILQFGKKKPVINDELLSKVDLPYLVLYNHQSYKDFYYLYNITHPQTPTCVLDIKHFAQPFQKLFYTHCGFIPRKNFTDDPDCLSSIEKFLKDGYPVLYYPEGRLSPDGRTNTIIEKRGEFYKKLGVDLVIVKLDGGYYAKPKWRGRSFSSNVNVTVTRVIKSEELANMAPDEIDRIIADELYNDESLRNKPKYKQPDKASGLESILYRCADCGALYQMKGRGNELKCHACGASHTFDNTYHFTGSIKSIPEYYDKIRNMEEKEIDSLNLSAPVVMKVYNEKGKSINKESGTATLNKNQFIFKSDNSGFTIPVKDLSALKFTCKNRFELYHDGMRCCFYPKENKVQVARWALIVDILTNKR